jgi:diguanylate cyclase (GGDEF)-like protein
LDAKSVYITVTLVILANGGMLSAIIRDFPVSLRPAAISWMRATVLVALGCATFATSTMLPQTLMVMVANACLFGGLCYYYSAIRRFYNLPPVSFPWLLPIAAMVVFSYFAIIRPDTFARIIIISVVWILLMAASIRVLADRQHADGSRSRMMLLSLYSAAMITTFLRAVIYAFLGPQAGMNIADNTNWINAVTPVFLALLPILGTTAFILMCTDRIRRRWERAASKDYLTGLPNRRTLSAIGADKFRYTAASQGMLAVAVLDIDDFKLINDSHGHDVGDRVLKHVAGRLQSAIMADDFVARSGGEEFVIVYGDANSRRATAATEALRVAIDRADFAIDGVMISVTASFGVARQTAASPDFDSVLRDADMALYVAKAHGKNRVELAYHDN